MNHWDSGQADFNQSLATLEGSRLHPQPHLSSLKTIYSQTSYYRFTAAFSRRKLICSGVKRQEKQLLPERAAPLSYVSSQFFFKISLESKPWFCTPSQSFLRAPGIPLTSSINIPLDIKKHLSQATNKKRAQNPPKLVEQSSLQLPQTYLASLLCRFQLLLDLFQ